MSVDMEGRAGAYGVMVRFLSDRARLWASQRIVEGCLAVLVPATVGLEIFDTLPDDFTVLVEE